nr:PREDICTED: polycystic kidney disease protein 1-like 1 [Lepisosteus oculatus]
MPSVEIRTDKSAYATDSEVVFVAVTEEPGPLEFLWHFGDKSPERTVSRRITKRFPSPGRYNVIVEASNELFSFASGIYPLTVQRAVQPNRLFSDASALPSANVRFDCRINAGTSVSYRWDFGDGNRRTGRSSEYHVFNRTGEFTVEVTMFNLVSSASLTRQIFIVPEPCQPPPVKNMGPFKVKVSRHEALRLGVTFEADVQCGESRALLYRWAVYDASGAPVLLPPVESSRQVIKVPKHSLHYGTYTAVARVQIKGSVVYSNYSVRIEVVPTPPVSIIIGGTNIFISSKNESLLTLDGRGSYDPDYPHNPMRYRWDCEPVSGVKSSCFDSPVPLSSPVVRFPAGVLKRTFDQFRFELKAQSGDRCSAAEMFVTVKEGLSRKIRVTCPKCRGSTVNWNEQFSVQALCENCGESENVTFTWNLYLVNASSKIVLEVPFCKTLDVSVPAGFLKEPPSAAHTPPASSSSSSSAPPPSSSPPVSRSSPPSRTSPAVSSAPTGASVSPKHPAAPLTADTLSTSPLSTSGPSLTPVTFFPADPLPFPFPFPEEGEPPGGRPRRERSPAPTGPERRTNSPTPSGPAPDYELYYNEIEEADSGTYEGRPIGSGISVEEPWGPEPAEGNDLVAPHSALVKPPIQTLLDLDRQLVDKTALRTLTLTGISSPVITFKPFMLKAKSLYMLEVTAASKENSLGKTQFFFSTNEVPDGMTCQVQPSKGYEVHTDFSIFCTSGKEDLLYEYSFSTGPSPRTVLYRGWDFQYYFKLPSGDPADNYKVTIYTEIRNRFGSATKLCAVNVTVLPSFRRNLSSIYSPDQELYVDGLRNLTALLQMGNIVETRNYVVVLTRVLNRLSPGPAAVRELQRQIRMALISAVCQLPVDDQESMIDNLSMLKDLIHVTDQLALDSARRVTSHIRAMAARLHEPGAHTSLSLDEWTANALVSLLAGVLEAPLDPGEEAVRLTTDSLRTASDLLLRFVLSSDATEHSVSTRLVEVKTRRLALSGGTVLGAGPASFRLPGALSGHGGGPCLVAQLVLLRRGLRLWSRSPAQIDGDVADLRLYNCTTRKERKVRSLSTPVHIEFEKRRNNGSSSPEYSLLRSQMNVHEFNVTAGHQQEALQITVQLTRPSSPPFPIMLLFRMFEKPTPSSYNVKRVHSWEGNTVHIFMPPLSVKDPGSYYVALLNADYNRTPTNKYIASAVSYTLSIEWTQCLYWDGGKDWRSEGCSPLQSWSASKVNCSCNHLTTFTIAYQEVSSHYYFTDVSQFVSLVDNLVLCSVTFVFLGIYLVLAVVCKRADLECERRSGLVFLQDNSPLDRQFYTITVDTGFRSRATMTAKVHIVLHGEDGTSETRELSCSGKLLFGRNSRHTFILSAPDSLGPIWKVHIWHDGRGPSPSWFVSHLAVRDVASGTGWLFPAECWLAADEGDGKVERELTPLTQSPGFGKLLSATLTELLEDFHLWASVCTRPSHSPVSHSQRLALCLLLLLGYTGLNALLVHLRDDQFSAALGLIDVSCDSLVMGVCSTLTVFPLVVLVSLLFRFSEVTAHKHTNTGDHSAGRAPDIFSVEAHLDGLLAEDSLFESYQSWHSLQHWAQEVWRKKYERGGPDGRALSVVSGGQGGQCGSERSSSGFEDGSPAARTLQSSSDLSCTPQGCALQQHTSGGRRALPPWCRHVAWALCLSLSATCAIVTGVLGMKFSSSQCLLWIHSVFVSLLFCVSVLQPVVIFIMAVVVSLKNKDHCDFYKGHDETCPALQMVENWRLRGGCAPESHLYSPYHHRQRGHTHFDRIVAARQRARYLRLVRPPSPAQLRELRDRMKKESLLQNNFRELALCTLMLLLLLFVTYGKFSSSHYRLNHAVRTEFTRSPKHPFLEVKTHKDWWNWCLTTFLDGLYWDTWYNNASARNKAGAVRGTCVLIGEPTLKKVEATADAVCEVSTVPSVSHADFHLTRFPEPRQFNFYLEEFDSLMDELLFRLNALSDSLHHTLPAKEPVTAILISLLYYACSLYNYILTVESIDHLQRENFKAFVDLSLLSSWEQLRRGLHGLMVSLLLVKCVFVLRVNKLMALSVTTLRLSFSSLTGPVVAGVIIIAAYACLGNLIFLPTSRTFSTFTRALQTLLTHHMGQRQLQTLSSPQSANQLFLALYYGTLMDELLFRLNALSDSLHHTLPAKEPACKEGESSGLCQSDCDCSLDSEVTSPALSTKQHAGDSEGQARRKGGKTEALLFQDGPETYHASLPLEEGTVRKEQNQLRSQLEWEPLRPLRRKGEGIAPTGSRGNPEQPSCSPDRAGPPCAGVRAGPPAADPDHYSLASLGHDLPHVLCGTRCPEKRASQCGAGCPGVPPTGLPARNRRVLTRSRSAVIQTARLSGPRSPPGGSGKGRRLKGRSRIAPASGPTPDPRAGPARQCW